MHLLQQGLGIIVSVFASRSAVVQSESKREKEREREREREKECVRGKHGHKIWCHIVDAYMK